MSSPATAKTALASALTGDVRALMAAEIAACGGNEVFFLGHTDANLCVVEVEALARGHAAAVPAVVQHCRYGDVVLHNHPSGNLTPSGADLEIASSLASLGVGFYIVNNLVDGLYRVVEPFPPHQRSDVDPAAVAALLGPGGAVANAHPDYEERPQQLRMALTVAEAFNQERLAVIEAGTGTGKSLAYLVPALLWALANEERVIVSTNTINLQEQLIRKDLPFLQRAAGLSFRAVLVKGRGNYLCLRRAESVGAEPGLFDSEQSAFLAAILEWGEKTHDGSREELPFLPPDELWEEVCCEADQCARVRCQHFSRCFFHKARRYAAQADLLVVNHALLLSDLNLRRRTDNYTAAAVLPPAERIILDEAHHLEDVATHFFSTQVTRFAFARPLNRLRHPRKLERGLIPRFLTTLGRELPDSCDELYRSLYEQCEALLAARQGLAERSVAILEGVGLDLLLHLGRKADEREEVRQRVVPEISGSDFWEKTTERLRGLGSESAALGKGVRELIKQCGALPEETATKVGSFLVDLGGVALRLEDIAADLSYFVAAAEGTCAWFEVGQGRVGRGTALVTRLNTAPLEVAGGLKEALFERYRTVVMTSATLAVGNSFDYFSARVGLDRCEPRRRAELLLASPFDYRRQALVAIPADLPETGSSAHADVVRDLCERAILAADGRTFVLFTAYSLLRRIHGELAPILGARGYRCLRQGEEQRHQLLKSFAADPTSVLFGTDSFWEGVDVPGRALEQVIITRLPFKVPTEPVLEARAEAISAAGGDPFMAYTVPQAVIKFKQGFGRLIRHRSDRGVVLILDSRVVKKNYGRIFLRSLPEATIASGPTAEVMAAVAGFFAAEAEEGGEEEVIA